MTARDELRGTLSNTVCNASNYAKRAQPYLMGSDMSVVLDKTADAILAAGYRKPRVIETAEELDALPNGSIVVDSEPDVLAKKGGKWQSPNYADDRFDSRHLDFPVTVISEGATK